METIKTESFVKQTDGTYKVTLKDLQDKLSKLRLINLIVDSKQNFDLMNRITVDEEIYLKRELSTIDNEVLKFSINGVVNRNDRDIIEIVLTGDFKNDIDFKLVYKFVKDDVEIDYGLKQPDPFSLSEN